MTVTSSSVSAGEVTLGRKIYGNYYVSQNIFLILKYCTHLSNSLYKKGVSIYMLSQGAIIPNFDFLRFSIIAV